MYFRYRFVQDPENIEVFRGLDAAEAERLCLDILDQALQIDPDNAIGPAFLGWRLGFVENKLREAAPFVQRALLLGPEKADVLRVSINYAIRILRFDEAIRLGEYALVRDPLCRRCRGSLANAYVLAKQYQQAADMMGTLTGAGGGAEHGQGMIMLLLDQPAEALTLFQSIEERQRMGSLEGQVMALHSLGRRKSRPRYWRRCLLRQQMNSIPGRWQTCTIGSVMKPR
jgi:tetratricopeptide (TPR) repeat protein